MQERATATIAAIVADDELLAMDELSFLLNGISDVEIVGTASNGIEAVDLIERLEPDIAFLDIQMPGLEGTAVIRRVREKGIEPPHFVFVTAHDRYAVEAFRLEAVDYLLKPVDKARLEETLDRVRRIQSEKRLKALKAEAPPQARTGPVRTKLMVRSGARNFIVDSQELIYATIDSGLITLVTTAVEGQSNYRTIEELQANLDPESFWRVHRSFLINIHRIKEVVPWFKSSYQLRMDDKKHTEIPVSRVQTKRLRELLRM